MKLNPRICPKCGFKRPLLVISFLKMTWKCKKCGSFVNYSTGKLVETRKDFK